MKICASREIKWLFACLLITHVYIFAFKTFFTIQYTWEWKLVKGHIIRYIRTQRRSGRNFSADRGPVCRILLPVSALILISRKNVEII
jgi:hypothetical protein